MKYLFLFIIVIFFSFPAIAQTHEQSTQTVTNAYWQYLNRPPDVKGLDFWTISLENGNTDLNRAFTESLEFQANPVLNSGIRDYTKFPVQEITVNVKFVGRDLVGTGLDPEFAFAGNSLTVNDSGQLLKLWVNFRVAFGQPSMSLTFPQISELSNTKSLTITYNPVTGVISKIRENF